MTENSEIDGVAVPPPVVTEPDDAAPTVPEPRVEVVRNDRDQRYQLTIDDRIAGIAEFRIRDGHIVFTHTETLPSYKGRGVATTLIERMLADVRERGERIIAKCPFVRAYLAEHHDYDDILDQEQPR